MKNSGVSAFYYWTVIKTTYEYAFIFDVLNFNNMSAEKNIDNAVATRYSID